MPPLAFCCWQLFECRGGRAQSSSMLLSFFFLNMLGEKMCSNIVDNVAHCSHSAHPSVSKYVKRLNCMCDFPFENSHCHMMEISMFTRHNCMPFLHLYPCLWVLYTYKQDCLNFLYDKPLEMTQCGANKTCSVHYGFTRGFNVLQLCWLPPLLWLNVLYILKCKHIQSCTEVQ